MRKWRFSLVHTNERARSHARTHARTYARTHARTHTFHVHLRFQLLRRLQYWAATGRYSYQSVKNGGEEFEKQCRADGHPMNPEPKYTKAFACSDNAPISVAHRLRAKYPERYGGVRLFSGPMHTRVGDLPHWRNNYFIILALLST